MGISFSVVYLLVFLSPLKLEEQKSWITWFAE